MLDDDLFLDLDLDEFFKTRKGYRVSKRSIGLTLITPYETISKMSYDYMIRYHIQIVAYILKYLVNDKKNVDFANVNNFAIFYSWINTLLTNGEQNFIALRHINGDEEGKQVTIHIPAYITHYELEELYKLDKKFKELNVNPFVSITNYNPEIKDYDLELLTVDYEEKDNLKRAMEFIIKHNRIKDYEIKEIQRDKIR